MKNLDKRITDLPLSIYNVISKIDELNGEFKTKRALDTVRSSGKKADLRIMVNRSDQEAHSYCEALEDVFAHARDIDVTEDNILNLHTQLFRYVDKKAEHKGSYKRFENKVETTDRNGKVLRVLVTGTAPNLTPQELNHLITWLHEVDAAEAYHPLIIISAFLAEFLKIHPFYDGNGRVSRMLTNLLLLKAGYDFELYFPHEKIIEDDTESYYVALSKSQSTFDTESGSILSWTEYFLRLLVKQATEAGGMLASEGIV